jgi:membrane glycosyltransferase
LLEASTEAAKSLLLGGCLGDHGEQRVLLLVGVELLLSCPLWILLRLSFLLSKHVVQSDHVVAWKCKLVFSFYVVEPKHHVCIFVVLLVDLLEVESVIYRKKLLLSLNLVEFASSLGLLLIASKLLGLLLA